MLRKENVYLNRFKPTLVFLFSYLLNKTYNVISLANNVETSQQVKVKSKNL